MHCGRTMFSVPSLSAILYLYTGHPVAQNSVSTLTQSGLSLVMRRCTRFTQKFLLFKLKYVIRGLQLGNK